MNFKRYIEASDTWVDSHYIMGTSTDTITTPANIYANDTTATVGLQGNMSQSSQPTPTTPIQPSECGDLETTGAHAGQYKIPILCGNQTTNIYLGETQSTRWIKKLMLTGEESYDYQSQYSRYIFTVQDAFADGTRNTQCVCTHYQSVHNGEAIYNIPDKSIYINQQALGTQFCIKDEAITSSSDFKAYLAAQYANGTPVTIWYALAEPETGIVNEPIRKIGDYADTVSGITIPTIAGANTISISTTLQPSEVSVNYHGWHPVADVHERDNGQWD